MNQSIGWLWQLVPKRLRRAGIWVTHPTFTVGALAVVLNDQGKLLLMRHRLREEQGWEVPGGLIGRRERPEDTVRREVFEETGYEVEVRSPGLVCVSRPQHMDVYYLARIQGGTLRLNAREIMEARFFALHDLPAELPTDQRHFIEDLLKTYG